MKTGHVAVLLKKEMFQGSKNFFFIFAIGVPLAMALFVSLAFGTLFSGKAALGIYTEAPSELSGYLVSDGGIKITELGTEEELMTAVADGKVDVGIILPKNLDEAVRAGTPVTVSAYVWGESLANHRITALLYLTGALRRLAGHTDPPVEIVEIPVGDERAMPWSERLLPLVVLMAVAMTGLALAGSSLLNEKMNRTLEALNVTQVTVGEIFLAKGIFAVFFGLVMGVIILALNRAFGSYPGMLILLLAAGSIMMSCIGILLGSMVKDTTGFFAAIKGIGFFLYLPALLFMFPQVPRWISMIFPTHYLLHPITEITLKGKTPGDILPETAVLAVIVAILVAFVIRRAQVIEDEGD